MKLWTPKVSEFKLIAEVYGKEFVWCLSLLLDSFKVKLN